MVKEVSFVFSTHHAHTNSRSRRGCGFRAARGERGSSTHWVLARIEEIIFGWRCRETKGARGRNLSVCRALMAGA